MRSQAQTPALVGPDAPTLAREEDLPSHGAFYCSDGDPKGVQGGERKATLLA